MVLGVDLVRALMNESDNIARDLVDFAKKDNIEIESVQRVFENSSIEVNLQDEKSVGAFERFVMDKLAMELIQSNGPKVLIDLNSQRKNEIQKQTIAQALETLRNRIDEFGVAEPSIQAQGHDRIVVQLPGMQNPERAKSVLGKTAQLEFKIVDRDSLSMAELETLVDSAKQSLPQKFNVRDLNRALQGKIPSGTSVLFRDLEDASLDKTQSIPILVKTGERLTGDMLDHAQMGFDENNWPEVHLRFNATGTEVLDQISQANIGAQLAIILDDKVYSDPVLQTRISDGRPRITFGGLKSREQTFQEAKDLAIVLRAGALPAPVEILESRSVGPSLGRDSIENGLKAILIGVFAVLIFMMVYYKLAGVVANLAVLVNMIFVLASLALLGATLTLPGIAGILISIGMAVDANVIIYERIREELLSGKSIKSALDLGYERAHLTIMDSNLTTIITGLVLMEFGSGPIKGFAVTLIFGLIANYFTALWFTKLIFEWGTNTFNPKRFSI